MQRRETHRRWRCPKCKGTFENVLPCTAVYCPKQYHGTRKDPVAMVPVEEAHE